MNFRMYGALQQAVRSYFRFHKTWKAEDFDAEKCISSEKRLKIKEHVPVKKEHISAGIVFRTVEDGDAKPRNCVLFFPHVNTPPDSVEKICSIYHSYGLDVVSITPKKVNFYSPSKSQPIVEELVNKLSGNSLPLNMDKFLVHATSTGAFFYAFLSNYLTSWNGSFNTNRIKGQVFDRLVLGDPSMALSQFGSPISRIFASENNSVGEISHKFANSPIHTETLVYHSFDDAFTPSAEVLIQSWRKKRLDISVSSWKSCIGEDSYSSHPIAYTRALESFLIKIGFA